MLVLYGVWNWIGFGMYYVCKVLILVSNCSLLSCFGIVWEIFWDVRIFYFFICFEENFFGCME